MPIVATSHSLHNLLCWAKNIMGLLSYARRGDRDEILRSTDRKIRMALQALWQNVFLFWWNCGSSQAPYGPSSWRSRHPKRRPTNC
jgi:hypothetical protein